MKLKLKIEKFLERLQCAYEKIGSLENANSSLREENNKLQKNLIIENKIKGGIIIYLIIFLNKFVRK